MSKKYYEDFKNLKPLPLDRIQRSERQRTEAGGQNPEVGKTKEKTIKIPIELKEVSVMEPLSNSKTLWGFGIAVFIYILQNILVALNVAGPDNLIMKAVVEAVIAIAGFFGIYGIRDALRKMNL